MEKNVLFVNTDGTSCFLHALLVAVLAPVQDNAVASALLAPEHELSRALRRVLLVLHGRGQGPLHPRAELCTIMASSSAWMRSLGSGQQDPAQFLQAMLFCIHGVDVGLFKTRRVTRKTYPEKVEEEVREEAQRFENLQHDQTDLSAAFPHHEVTIPSESSDGLLTKVERSEFLSGSCIIFTRDRMSVPLKYGVRNPLTRTYDLIVKDAHGRSLQFELQAVVVWRGVHLQGGGTAGHYAAFMYRAEQRQWFFVDDAVEPGGPGTGCAYQAVPVTECLEAYPAQPRWRHGRSMQTGKFAAQDLLQRHIVMFDTQEQVDAHKAAHDHEVYSPWAPSMHGTMFFFTLRV
jgi:hypothetical protein